MKDIIVSVVSHGHFEVIRDLECLKELASIDGVSIFVIDNLKDNRLRNYCDKYAIEYIGNDKKEGFGANNNIIFKRATSDAISFLVLNPDVAISKDVFTNFVTKFQEDKSKIATINLFKDAEFKIYDNSIRCFPKLRDFFSSFVLGKNRTLINKSNHRESFCVDWAAGSFLAFSSDFYRQLGGFDERYFMYCEDLDICWRAFQLHDQKVKYYPMYKAQHIGAFSNRKLFSKHFYWHLRSAFIYLTKTWRHNGE